MASQTATVAQTISTETTAASGRKPQESGPVAQTLPSFTQAQAGQHRFGDDRPDASGFKPFPKCDLPIDVSVSDFDATINFNMGFFRWLYVGGAGDVSVLLLGDDAPTVYKAVLVGTTLEGLFTKVTHTNTTATLLVCRN